jgi:acyl carrier protein
MRMRARGVLRTCAVRRDASVVETLILVVATDFDIAGACAEIGRVYEGVWPTVVVLLAPAGGNGPEEDGALLAERVDQVLGAPETAELRAKFGRLVMEVLEATDVSEGHYFFVDAGGDSITALQLSSAVEERFGFELPLEVLVALTVGGVADLVASTSVALKDRLTACVSSTMERPGTGPNSGMPLEDQGELVIRSIAPATSASQSAAGRS